MVSMPLYEDRFSVPLQLVVKKFNDEFGIPLREDLDDPSRLPRYDS